MEKSWENMENNMVKLEKNMGTHGKTRGRTWKQKTRNTMHKTWKQPWKKETGGEKIRFRGIMESWDFMRDLSDNMGKTMGKTMGFFII